MENASKALIIAGAILIAILLITIGIVLINSGRDVTETGTAGMQSQKIQTFNAQFTVYEGTKKGAELRSLISTVNASNATDAQHQVAVYATVDSISKLESTKEYNVEVNYSDGSTTPSAPSDANKNLAGTLSKSEKGYINLIKIAE